MFAVSANELNQTLEIAQMAHNEMQEMTAAQIQVYLFGTFGWDADITSIEVMKASFLAFHLQFAFCAILD